MTTLTKCDGSAVCSICDWETGHTHYLAVRGDKSRVVCEDCRGDVLKMKSKGTYSTRPGIGLFCKGCGAGKELMLAIDQNGEIVSDYLCPRCIEKWFKENEW